MSPSPNTPPQVFSRACLAAVREFRHAKPWRGNIEERKDKFTALHTQLCAAYGLNVTLTFAEDIDPLGKSGVSRFELGEGTITLHFRLSVVTYFAALASARSFPYPQAWAWAVALYRRMFPKSAVRHSERDGFIVPNPGQ